MNVKLLKDEVVGQYGRTKESPYSDCKIVCPTLDVDELERADLPRLMRIIMQAIELVLDGNTSKSQRVQAEILAAIGKGLWSGIRIQLSGVSSRNGTNKPASEKVEGVESKKTEVPLVE